MAEEPNGAIGTLRTAYPLFRLTLVAEGADGAGPMKVDSQEGAATLAPGRYTVLNWEVEAPDGKGRTWRAAGNMLPRPVEVRAGEETRLALAAPLQAHLYTFPEAETVLFRMSYTGSMGERVREIQVDGKEAPPPWLKIVSADGKVVEVLPFEPG